MERQIRLCIVSQLFHPNLGGVGKQAVLLAEKLRKRGIELFVFARKMINIPDPYMPSDINVYYIPAFRPHVHNLEDKSLQNLLTSLSFSLMLAYKLFSMRDKYDLVHFHGASLPLIICLPLLKLFKKRVISKVLAGGLGTEAGSLRRKNFLIGGMLSMIVKHTDMFIAITHEIADGLKNDGIVPERIFRITNFVDTTKFKPVSNFEREILKAELSLNENIVVNFTGRIVGRKGIDVLMNAFAHSKELLDSAILIVIGTGDYEAGIQDLVKKLGIEKKVRFFGYSNDVVKYYRASDIFVLPSYAEGMPNSLLEAMACGLPVIASRIGGVVDVLGDGKSGIFFEPGDVSCLSSAMISLVKNEELRNRLGIGARKRILKDFPIDRMADEYIKLYEELLSNEC